MADLLQDNLALGERLDKHGIRLYNLENLDIPHKVSQAVDEIVTDAVDWAMQAPLRARLRDLPTVDTKEKSLELDYSNQRLADQEEARKKRRKRRDAPRSPPGSPPSQPPPPPPPAGASGAPGTSGASGSSQLPPPLPPPSTGTSGSTPQQGCEAPSSSKTTASAQQSMAWTISDTRYESTGIAGVQELSPSDDLMHDDSAPDEQVQVSDDQDSGNDHTPAAADSRKDWWKPLPEEERPATPEPAWTIPSSHNCLARSISKMKAASYPDFGLDLLEPEQIWIDDVCTYDIDYLSEIVLRIADHQEHKIAEKYPSDFKDLSLLLLQGYLDHLSGSDKRMLSTTVKLHLNLTKLGWDGTGYEFKHDYTVIESPRAVIFPVNNNE
ncbi:hypothetical protein Tco_1125480 [Tanacetum coccineum]|uniref:Uncharacterized protein n=1 Tax=Tanacetum coccineum TaxID=301880 RepID=A0ABQ5JAU3_9ASTR